MPVPRNNLGDPRQAGYSRPQLERDGFRSREVGGWRYMVNADTGETFVVDRKPERGRADNYVSCSGVIPG